MRPLLLLLTAATLGTHASAGEEDRAPAKKSVLVSGSATRVHETHPCMGGVHVTEDMILRESAPLTATALTVFAGTDLTGKVVARPKTDAAGRFSLSLPPGPYCFVVGEREPLVPPSVPSDEGEGIKSGAADPYLDPDCLERLANPVPRCDLRLTVQEGASANAPLVLYSSNQCPQQWAHPCWRGPMPP